MAKLTALSDRHYKAIEALLSAPNVDQASKECQVPKRTIYRWLKDPTFAAAYYDARQRGVQQAVGRVHALAWVGVSVLIEFAADKRVPANVRLAAASKLIDLAVQTAMVDQLQHRLEKLEALYEHKS